MSTNEWLWSLSVNVPSITHNEPVRGGVWSLSFVGFHTMISQERSPLAERIACLHKRQCEIKHFSCGLCLRQGFWKENGEEKHKLNEFALQSALLIPFKLVNSVEMFQQLAPEQIQQFLLGEGFCGWRIVALVGAADVVWQPLSLGEDSTKELWLECVFVRVVLTSVCLCVYVCAHESQSGVGLTERSAGWLEHAGSFPQSRQHSVPNEFSSGRAFALGHNHKAYCYRHKRGVRGMGPVNGDRRDPSGMRIRDREAKRKWSIIFYNIYHYLLVSKVFLQKFRTLRSKIHN